MPLTVAGLPGARAGAGWSHFKVQCRRQTPRLVRLGAPILLAASSFTATALWAQAAMPADEMPVGQPPTYEYRPAIGAGSTGFNSAKRPLLRGSSVTLGSGSPQPAVSTALAPLPLPSAISDARLKQMQNRTRPGAPGSDATARSTTASASVAPVGVPPASPPQARIDPVSGLPETLVRKPVVDDKPFDPLGIRAGSFLLKPALEVSGGYDSNPARTNAGGGASDFGIVAPQLQLNSNWSRHELTANLRGSYIAYGAAASVDRPAFDGKINGRIDVTSQTRIDLESRLIVATDNPGSPDIQAGLARLPVSTDLGGTIGFGRRFNRVDVEIKGGVDRTTYQRSVFTDGTVLSNDDRNFNQYGAQLRAGYELTPGIKPFVELDADRRHHDLPFDTLGFARDSDGAAAKVGSTFELSRILTGQIAFGYLDRRYGDPALPMIAGPTLDASLTWVASALTTFKFTAVTSANESTLFGVSGVFTHELSLEVDHAFRTWLDATLKLTGYRDAYVGSARLDDRYAAAFDLTYKLNREMQLKGEVRREWLTSNEIGNDYQAYVGLLGVRLQR
jgi:hypothetical protein